MVVSLTTMKIYYGQKMKNYKWKLVA